MIKNERFLLHNFEFGDTTYYAIAGPIHDQGGSAWYYVAPPKMTKKEAEEFLRKQAEIHLKS